MGDYFQGTDEAQLGPGKLEIELEVNAKAALDESKVETCMVALSHPESVSPWSARSI